MCSTKQPLIYTALLLTVQATGVRSITFHPDGKTLFCGLDSSFKVYSWEPVICHDAVDIGWSTLGDLCINDGKLLGCSYYQNSIGVWAADVSQIEPYSKLSKKTTRVEPKSDLRGSLVERVETVKRSSTHSDDDTKDIKNIYVDSMTAVASRKHKSLSKVVNLTSPKETETLRKHKHTPAAEKIEQKNSVESGNVLPDNSDTKYLVKSRKKLVAGSTGLSLKPPHRGRPSSTKLDIEDLSASVETLLKSGSDTVTNTNIQRRLFTDDRAKDSSSEKTPTSTCSKSPSRSTHPNDNCDVPVGSKKGLNSVKYVNGVAVMNGRTRSLVEKFENRDNLDTDECHKSDPENVPATTVQQSIDVISSPIPEATTSPMQVTVPDIAPYAQYVAKTSRKLSKTPDLVSSPESEATKSSDITHKKPDVVSSAVTEAKRSQMVKSPDLCREKLVEANTSPLLVKTPKTSPNMVSEKAKASSTQRSVVSRRVIPEKVHSSPMLVTRRSRTPPHMIHERTRTSPVSTVSRHDTSTYMTTIKEDIPQTTGRCMTSKIDDDLAEDLMLDHDLSLSILRSRLTKLQVVKQFWQRNDMMGAISALQKLPDHAVHADVISVMLNNIESLTIDLFSCLLPILFGLLNSETERHINVSLEMLLKLVVVFGSAITSTISAPPAVGVDLHAEKRLESCNQCHVHLQKIHRSLPNVIRRGGLTARSAQELNLRLQQS
ncbi:katanin p80 WD40 repeat-containing subunit B1 homolog isoform X1 [Tanacetum coccineum]